MCCPDVETLFINCKPFYSPWEFCSFILVSVYIPPQEHVSLALQKLADLITETEQQHPDSVLFILGDFNKANLSRELPKYRQHVTCPTRDSNILDHCYTAIKDAYHSVPDCNIIYQFLWGCVHSYQFSFNLQQWQTMVHCKTLDSSVRPKKMLAGMGTDYCINRPNTHWKRRPEWQEELFWKAKEPILFQWSCLKG